MSTPNPTRTSYNLPEFIPPLKDSHNMFPNIKDIIGTDLHPLSAKAIEIFQCAVSYGNSDVAEQLIRKGVPIDAPPQRITLSNLGSDINSYVPSPYIILASSKGHLSMVECLRNHSRKLEEIGHIGFSPRAHNSVVSNCLGAAAYNGHFNIVKWILNSKAEDKETLLHFKSEEYEMIQENATLESKEKKIKDDKDKQTTPNEVKESSANHTNSKNQTIQKEANDKELFKFTPIMLSIAGKGNVNVVKLLIENDIKWNTNEVNGGSLLHLCVEYDKPEILRMLISPRVGMNPFKKLEVIW